MFGFQGGESADTVGRKKGYMTDAQHQVVFSDELRSLDDQDRGAALLNGQNALRDLGGTGETRR